MRITLKRAFADGTLAVDMDLLCRLAASVPPPRFHTVKYAGVLAPPSRWRARIAPKPPPIDPAAPADEPVPPPRGDRTRPPALHVDGAMAGSAMILPECRPLWQGIEGADSLVVNPHKWLGASFDCSLYYVRDPGHLVRVMSTNPSYLQSAVDSRVKNLRDWGIPLGRRFRALKLWCLIREQGVEGLRARLRRDLANARWLAVQVAAAAGWRVLAGPPADALREARAAGPGRRSARSSHPGLTGEVADEGSGASSERAVVLGLGNWEFKNSGRLSDVLKSRD